MKNKRIQFRISIAAIVLAVIALGIGGYTASQPGGLIQARGISNFSGLDIDMNMSGTATPALSVNQDGSGAVLRVLDAETPVFEIYDGGAQSYTGDLTQTGDQAIAGAVAITVPTAEATAVSGLDVVQNGVGEVAEFNDGTTELLAIRNGGGVVVSAPTAIATAQPALVADSSGGLSNIFEVRDSATPVVYIEDGGNTTITGGQLNVGGATADVAAGDNDLVVAGDLEVDGEIEADGTVDIDGVMNLIVGTEHIGAVSVVSTAITYTAAAGGTGAVATIGDGEIWLVHDVFVNVTTNFDCTGDDVTLVIGDGNDADGFTVLADTELQASDTEATGYAAGWQGLIAATQGAYIDEAAGANTFIYAPSGAAETIDWLVDETSGETITAGAATIYVIYTRIQ